MKKALVLACFILLSAFVSASDVHLVKVTGHSNSPSKVYPGDIVALVATISSTSGRMPATDVNATLSVNESYFEPIHLFEQLGTISPGDSKSAVFRFRVREDAYAGLYNFAVKLNYLNDQTPLQKSEDVNMAVLECYSVDVGNLQLDNYSPHIGEVFNIKAELSNACSGEARDVVVELKPVTNATLGPFIAVSDTILQLGNISSGKSKEVRFALRASDKAEPKTYVFSIDANCLDCSKTDTENFSFEVRGKPNLIISGIDLSIESRTDDKKILPGDTFSLSIQLDNIGKETAKAVSVVISTDGSISGIKEGYAGNIDEDDSGAVIFTLTVSPLAETGEHKTGITVNYIDEMDAEQAMEKSFALYVNQRPPESPIGLLVLIIIILVLLYFIIKMAFRQLAMRRA